jgi:hypothetical protein
MAQRPRIAVPDLRGYSLVDPQGVSQQSFVQCVRGRNHACKLTREQEAALRHRGGTSSLRVLAAEFGVSHETARSVLRRSNAADAGKQSTGVAHIPRRVSSGQDDER